MSIDTEEFLRNQPRTRPSKEQEEFCNVLKHILTDAAYVVVINPYGLATFTALKRGLFRSPMDKLLWNGILQERMLVQRPEAPSEETGLGPKVMKVRDLGWKLIQNCTLSEVDLFKDDVMDAFLGIVEAGPLPSESLVRRVIAEDSEPWFTWPAQEQFGIGSKVIGL